MHTSTLVGLDVPHQAAGDMLLPETNSKPYLTSLDCGQECSLAHLLETYRLVEVEDRELKGYVFDDECLGCLSG